MAADRDIINPVILITMISAFPQEDSVMVLVDYILVLSLLHIFYDLIHPICSDCIPVKGDQRIYYLHMSV